MLATYSRLALYMQQPLKWPGTVSVNADSNGEGTVDYSLAVSTPDGEVKVPIDNTGDAAEDFILAWLSLADKVKA